MLAALDVHTRHRVLEIGSGTGWNAANLAAHVGETGRVVSIEVDPHIAEQARRNLNTSGILATVVTGDGTAGYRSAAPFDRVIATASVRRIPLAWIEQTRPGGVLVVPFGTDYSNGTLLRLLVDDDGTAVGRCGRNLAFMRLRQQRRDFLNPTEQEITDAEVTTINHSGRGAVRDHRLHPRCLHHRPARPGLLPHDRGHRQRPQTCRVA
ncbi:hypothetical protein GCM10011581_43320 [Saccharopolyspora subtropica]|uniref:Protein-L-isoaspartate O-methyltransferase n=2 Tax=Saccharopolyspora thermophila TaxID=89367 RepID=A0A917NHF7_9PSEU|nr:hypothetical protein GCM10011581_43320 [Saccharopolyspora subtropica]